MPYAFPTHNLPNNIVTSTNFRYNHHHQRKNVYTLGISSVRYNKYTTFNINISHTQELNTIKNLLRIHAIWIFLPCRCWRHNYIHGGYRNGFRGHNSAHKNGTLSVFYYLGMYIYVRAYRCIITYIQYQDLLAWMKCGWVMGKEKVPVDVLVVAWRFK